MDLAGDLETMYENILTRYHGDKPGAAFILIKNGEILLSKCVGMADMEKKIPVSSSTNFRLASVTKQFTAMCIMILVEKGKLSYGDTLRDVMPEFPHYADSITILDMLQHTSGLRSYDDLTPKDFEGQLRDGDVYRMLVEQESTLFIPGTRYLYSNDAYVLLGLIIERVSGVSFSEFMTREIFNKIGMKNSVLHDEGTTNIKNRAYGYAWKDEKFIFKDQGQATLLLGDGGVYTNLDDMYIWDQALYSEKLVSRETMQKACTRGTLTSGEETHYGYGWHLAKVHGFDVVYHGGSTSGFRNLYLRVPKVKFSTVLLTNRSSIDLDFGVPVTDFKTGIELILTDLLPYLEAS